MMGWVRRAAIAMGMLGLVFTTGCPGFFVYPGSSTGGSTGSGGNYVYVANATTDSIAGFSIGTSTLTALTNSPYSLGYSPTALAVNPANSILFGSGNGAIYAYAISSTGTLSILNSGGAVGAVGIGANVASMDVSPDGQWLLVLETNVLGLNSATVDVFQINSSTGLLVAYTGAIYTIPATTAVPSPVVVPLQVKVAPNGAYVFAAVGTGGDVVFPFNTSSGALSTPLVLTQTSSTSSDNALAVSPNSSYLYIARSGTSGGVMVFTIGSGGTLTQVSGSPFAGGSDPFSVALNSAGNDLYVANQQGGNISAYSIASNGALTALSGSPYSSGTGVSSVVADRTGTYLLAAARGGSPDLTMYTFDSTTVGKLDLATSTATGTDPTGAFSIAVTH